MPSIYIWRYLHLPYIPTHIVQLVKRMPGKGLDMPMVTMMTVMVVMMASVDERFVMLMVALAREPRAQRKDRPESVGENHVCRLSW
jgi:hypothetical protein